MKRAIVTGGAGLIGAGIIEALARGGWTVASVDLGGGGSDAQHVHCDVGDEKHRVLGRFRSLAGTDSTFSSTMLALPARTTDPSTNFLSPTGAKSRTAT